jgi:hypothetical protein
VKPSRAGWDYLIHSSYEIYPDGGCMPSCEKIPITPLPFPDWTWIDLTLSPSTITSPDFFFEVLVMVK